MSDVRYLSSFRLFRQCWDFLWFVSAVLIVSVDFSGSVLSVSMYCLGNVEGLWIVWIVFESFYG
jgi:hypothetical protein